MYHSFMTLSEGTQALLIDRAAVYTQANLTTLLKHANLGKNDPGNTNADGTNNPKPKRIACAFGPNPDEKSLVSLAIHMLNDPPQGPDASAWTASLKSSLFADGLSLNQDDASGEWSIGPVGSEETPLAPQVSQLEATLQEKGFTVEAEHYKQAYAAIRRQEWESANAAIRTTLEGVVLGVARAKFTFNGSTGGQAIEQMGHQGLFDQGEQDYLKGFWKMSHLHGSHPGLSNEAEAMFRFSAGTSALTYFIHRWV